MTKPTEGDYLFVHYGYGQDHQPELTLLAEDASEFTHLSPRGHTLTLRFDTTKRYCGGWHNLATTESFPCPDGAELPDQYNQCRHCQQKTGFNPAFYNAVSVSKQQQARNAQPHLLYLAHFAPSVVKVGITWAERGIKRLLDQGARSGLIIKVYPNADIARQYEAKAATLTGIAETLQHRQKYQLMQRSYDPTNGAAELLATRERLQKEISAAPEANEPIHLDSYYLGGSKLSAQLIDLAKSESLSGSIIGMVGSVLVAEQDGMQFTLPLSKFTGYRCTLSYRDTPNECEPQQVSLF